MRLLIIGGSGFVSGTLARVAASGGNEVWVVTRGKRRLPDGVRAIVADRKDADAFRHAIGEANQTWDLVVDCIGYEIADAMQDVEVFNRQRVGHFVFISTDFVFDPASRRFPQLEDGYFRATDDYGGKKRRCELEIARGATFPWTVVRPCHIYGPGSLLGCLPQHGRDPELIARLRRGEKLRLVGGGHFLQQPIYAEDLARLILACAGNAKAVGQTYNAAGPDIIESRRFYEIIAETLGTTAQIEEVPVDAYFREHPEHDAFLCHRIYDLSRARRDGLSLPATPIDVGLRNQVQSLLSSGS